MIKTKIYILISVYLTITIISSISSANRWPWQRRIGHNIDIHHKLQHERVTPNMWPKEPASPKKIDCKVFAAALQKLCGKKRTPSKRAQKYADAIIENAKLFDIDPFLIGALIFDQSRCLPKTPDSETKYGLSRIDIKMHAPHIRNKKYTYYILQNGNWIKKFLDVTKYPFNEWKAAAPLSNIYWTSAILRVFKEQHSSLDKAFPKTLHRHYVSHWFFGDNVKNSEPEERVLTLKRVLIDYYNNREPAKAGNFNGIPLVSPLDGTPRIVLDDFNVFRGNRKTGHIHQGIDLTAETDEQIHAMADGIVVFAGVDLPGSGSKNLTPEEASIFPIKQMGAGGLYVAINHGNGFRTYYMHMNTILVKERTKISNGDIIGTVGRTGATQSGSHLHLEFRIGKKRADPAQYIQKTIVDPKRIIERAAK